MHPSAAPREVILAVCTPIGDRPTVEYARSLRRLVTPMRRPGHPVFGGTHLFDVHELPIEEARRQLTGFALAAEPRVTHLLWIDDDMVFPPDALLRLLRHDVPIVGGLCHNRRPPYQPILARRNAPEWCLDDSHGFVYDYPPDTLFPVDATGGAFLLVKREVFEAIEAKHGEGSWWTPRDGQSEDFSFCARAQECGFKIAVDTGLDIGHVGKVTIDAAFARRNRSTRWQRHHPSVAPADPAGPPVASIVIPTFNQRPQLLLAAVHSARAQTEPVEVIVVDDGTTDYAILADEPGLDESPSAAYAARAALLATSDTVLELPPGVRLIRHVQNAGISAALNTGIAAARTDWICWLSSDDMLSPEKVAEQRAALVESGLLASFHAYEVMTEGAEWGKLAPAPAFASRLEAQRALAQGCCINGSTTMIHRSVFEEVGLYDRGLRYGQDWEMWCRIAERFAWLGLPAVLGTRREGGNLTQIIADAPEGDERRARRDAEDAEIRARFAPRCPHCEGAL